MTKLILCRISGRVMLAASVLFLFGTAGASDTGVLSTRQFLIRILIGLAVIALGLALIFIGEARRNKK